MGSAVMHLYISSKVKEKYGYNDEFLLGSVLPDIYKKTKMDRAKSHFLTDVKDGKKSYELPDVERFMKANKSKTDNEITLGYLAHLVEDKVWFKSIADDYVRYLGVDENGNKTFGFKDEDFKIPHSEEEMKDEMYKDYDYIGDILLREGSIDISGIISYAKLFFDDDPKMIEATIKELDYHVPTPDRKNRFISEEDAKKYINMTIPMVCEKIEEFKKLGKDK